MNSQTLGLRVATIVFALFALGHLFRVLTQSQVMVGVLFGTALDKLAARSNRGRAEFLDVETLVHREQITEIHRQAIK